VLLLVRSQRHGESIISLANFSEQSISRVYKSLVFIRIN
jgi:hypothetical protein